MNDARPSETVSDNTQLREELLCSIGSRLKTTREKKGLSIADVAQTLKLRQTYLNALENGNWEQMPGEIYAIGFLKQYAAFLGTDVGEEIATLKSEACQLTRPLTFPDPSIAPRKSWVLVAALAFVVLFILFNIFSDNGTEPTGTVLSPPTQTADEHEIAGEPSPEVATSPKAESAVTPAVEKTPAPAAHTYRFTATGSDCWIQISLPGEGETAELLQEALLKPGESLTLTHTAPYLLLTSGNAAALSIVIDGTTFAETNSLGRDAQVIRNLKLQPAGDR